MMLRALAALMLLWPHHAVAGGTPPAMAAVGVVKVGRSACSGTLIAADLVLTAGHCVLRADGRGAIAPRGVAFRTGAYPGFIAHQFRASDVVVHPFFIATDHGMAQRMGHDGGLVRLDEAVPPEVALPIPVVDPGPPGSSAFLASYRGGRGERARERRCPVIQEGQDVVLLSCDVRPGESGSPILVSESGRLGLVGIVSASSQVKRTEIALAAKAADLINGLKAMMGGF